MLYNYYFRVIVIYLFKFVPYYIKIYIYIISTNYLFQSYRILNSMLPFWKPLILSLPKNRVTGYTKYDKAVQRCNSYNNRFKKIIYYIEIKMTRRTFYELVIWAEFCNWFCNKIKRVNNQRVLTILRVIPSFKRLNSRRLKDNYIFLSWYFWS